METVKRVINGREFSIEAGKVAKQASGSVIVRYGDSVVLVTACLGEDKQGDFFPLTIDYVEKTYAAGKIPGGFFKREGRLGEKEILVSRVIDRPCRPMFPEGFTREVQVAATVLSADPQVDTDVMALCGASAAIHISEMPFDGPVAGVRVIRTGGKLVINPSQSEIERSDMNFVVAGTKDAIVMVEGGAKEISEAEVQEALFFAHEQMQEIIVMQDELRAKVGKPKIEFVAPQHDASLLAEVKGIAYEGIKKGLGVLEKLARRDALKAVKKGLLEKLVKPEAEDAAERTKAISAIYEDLLYKAARNVVFETGKRIDGRDTKTVRPISIEVGWLPRVHGSALFTRGETQAIVAATLGVESDAQTMDNLLGEEKKKFLLHYNFPPYSVGEVKPMRGPGRREYGHGALAERAVRAVMPSGVDFPYVVRLVSEITESNGSSSMATVCGSSLALLDAGIPIKAPVAGIAMGLIQEGEQVAVLTDILGDEDHLGDMDFKVCGTEKGITALQMDIKIKGLRRDIMSTALNQAKEGRLHILEKMKAVISAPRESVSKHAPRIITFKISQDKIRDLIGPGGKVIKSIQETFKVKMDISDDGTVTIAGSDPDSLKHAVDMAQSITAKPEEGKIYRGIVKRIADFGAFVEILPGTDGLVHISQLADSRVRSVTDVVQEGDEIYVKVLEVDRQGKIRLSLKDAIAEMGEQAAV
jgi:polyribonucleotide nucleotidyltransferase